MSDEGFHEIQLNGKQLVFLFMAATVVSVVIFLCGVMVGRGVRAPQSADSTVVDAPIDPTAEAPVSTAASPSTDTPISARETLTYPNRLEAAEPALETLREAPPPPRAVASDAPQPATEPVTTAVRVNTPPALSSAAAAASRPAAAVAPAALTGEPAGAGFVVQVAAVKQRGEADAIVRRLIGKGYPAFVTTPGSAAAPFYRVRVGKYEARREAESVAGRLEKEEQFKPWITR